MRAAVDTDPIRISDLVSDSYKDMKASLKLLDCDIPSFEEVKFEVLIALKKDY
ncbi:MAG: hypothetical protein ACO1OC_07480 [Tuberibacillus sp.]